MDVCMLAPEPVQYTEIAQAINSFLLCVTVMEMQRKISELFKML